MNGKRIISLLLALALTAGLLSLPGYAEEPEADVQIAQAVPDAGEAALFATALEPRPNRLVSLGFTGGVPVTLTDETGNVIPPRVEDKIVQSYLLPPGVYYYGTRDPEDPEGGLIIRRLELDGLTRELEIALTGQPAGPEEAEAVGEPRADSAGMFPVTLQGAEEPEHITVTGLDGAVMPPYTDPASGVTHYGCYLLAPGVYFWSCGDLEGSFEVDGSGAQTVALPAPEKPVSVCFTATAINPYYAGLIAESAIPAPSVSPEESLAALMGEVSRRTVYEAYTPVVYDNPEAAGAALKRGLIQRQQEIDIRVKCGVRPTDENWETLCWMLYDAAIRHTGAPTEGDYLRYEYGGVTCNGSAASTDVPGEYYYSFVYSPLYFTSYAQESELSARVAAVLGQLAPGGRSDEQKIRAVYQYLCDNVAYDYGEDPIVFTAYDALVNGRAACQGVAVAFYRLCLEMGLDARIVTSNGMGHAWNIVRADGRHYYALDATWEPGSGPESWEYYLRGRTSWLTEHELGDEFISGSFSAYDFPDTDYGAQSEAVIHQVSLLFDGMIRIKYYFAISDRLLDDPDACICFFREGELIQTTPLSACRTEGEYSCFYCGVSADSVAQQVQARIFDGGGNPVSISSRSGTTYPNGFFFSAMDYAQQMQDGGVSGSMRVLARALEDYGTAAENYFRKSGGALRPEVKAVTAADLAGWETGTQGSRPAGLNGAAISVMFEADNGLRVYLQFDDGTDLGRYSYAVDGREAVLQSKSDGACYLSVDNIAADALDTPHRFSVTDGTDTYTIVTSVLGYAKTAIERGDPDMADLARALFLYNRAAENYFGA